MALDYAGESLAERRPLHVHLLSNLEDLDADLSANFQRRKLFRRRLEFAQQVARLDGSFGQVPGERLPDARRTPLAERDLHGGIAVVVGCLDLSDPVVGHVQHGHGQGVAVVREDARHADLAADQSNTHVNPLIVCPDAAGPRLQLARRPFLLLRYCTLISTSTPAGKSSFIKASTVLSV